MMMIIIIFIFIIIIIKGIVQWTFHKLALLLLQLLPKVRVLIHKTQEKLLVNLTAPLHVQYSSACNKQRFRSYHLSFSCVVTNDSLKVAITSSTGRKVKSCKF